MASGVEQSDRVRALAKVLDAAGLRPDAIPHPCPYLPGQFAREMAFSAMALPPGLYQDLMALNFRRSGRTLYRPACDHCRQCQAIRLPVREFRPSRGQRRCLRRNADVEAAFEPAEPTDEKHDLYRRYLDSRHPHGMSTSRESFESFLYVSPLETVEITLRLDGRLIGCGILDVEPLAASAVYFFYDPAVADRSPGTLNVLRTIAFCRGMKLEHLYLGYYIRDCRKMNYKTQFRPCETLVDGAWHRLEPGEETA